MPVHEQPLWLRLLITCLTGVQRGLTEYGRFLTGFAPAGPEPAGKSPTKPLCSPEEPAGHRAPDAVERALWSQLEDLAGNLGDRPADREQLFRRD
jgi:hypothetical protein